jgi:uncharacterized protein
MADSRILRATWSSGSASTSETGSGAWRRAEVPRRAFALLAPPISAKHPGRGALKLRSLPVTIPGEFLKDFCERNYIRKLSPFGSVLSERFSPDSDVDILVDLEAGRIPGLITLVGMELELSQKLGRKVDLRTPEDLSRYFRAEVVASAFPQYERRRPCSHPAHDRCGG